MQNILVLTSFSKNTGIILTKIWNQETDWQLQSYIKIHIQYTPVYFGLHSNEKNVIHPDKHYKSGNFNSLLWNLKILFGNHDSKTLNRSIMKLCSKGWNLWAWKLNKSTQNLKAPRIAIIQFTVMQLIIYSLVITQFMIIQWQEHQLRKYV